MNGHTRTDSIRRIRRDATKLISELDIPEPFDVREFCQQVARRLGRPIRLCPVAGRLDTPCGLVLLASGTHYICYETQTSELHQEHIILHELGHILCGHEARNTLTADTVSTLVPDLNPEMVRLVLGRAGTHYQSRDEQQAEVIASIILQRAKRVPPTPLPHSDVAERIEHSLE